MVAVYQVCICPILKMYLSKLSKVFVKEYSERAGEAEGGCCVSGLYLSNFLDVFVQIEESICAKDE